MHSCDLVTSPNESSLKVKSLKNFCILYYENLKIMITFLSLSICVQEFWS